MPSYLHPGVYVEEIPSGSKPIEGVGTSTAAFVGYTTKGTIGEPKLIFKWDDYDTEYGGIRDLGKNALGDPMGLSVAAFFQNGGKKAYIVRITQDFMREDHAAKHAEKAIGYVDHPLEIGKKALEFMAVNEGKWSNGTLIKLSKSTIDDKLYDVQIIKETKDQSGNIRETVLETFQMVSLKEESDIFIEKVINGNSNYISVKLISDITSIVMDSDQYLGTSTSGDLASLSLDFSAYNATQRKMRITIDRESQKTITLDQKSFQDLSDLASNIQEKVREIDANKDCFTSFTCEARNYKLVLKSGTRMSISSVKVDDSYNMGETLKLGISTNSYLGTSTSGNLSTFSGLDLTGQTDAGVRSLGVIVDGAAIPLFDFGQSNFANLAAVATKINEIAGLSCTVTGNKLVLTSDSRKSTSSIVVISDLGLAPTLKLGLDNGGVELTGQQNHEKEQTIGTSTSGDLSPFGGLDLSVVPDAADRTLNVTVDGIAAVPLVFDQSNYGTLAAVAAKVSEINGLSCTVAGSKLVLTTDTHLSTSSVIVSNSNLATALKLGVNNGGVELTGQQIHDLNYRTELTGQEHADSAMAKDHLDGGEDGGQPGIDDYKKVFNKFVKYRDINIICLPGQNWPKDKKVNTEGQQVIEEAIAHAEKMKNRMVVVDPPNSYEITTGAQAVALGFPSQTYSVIYYPWIKVANKHYNSERKPGLPKQVLAPPCGYAAGMWAKIDGKRGVWKAPAGMETGLLGVSGLEFPVEDDEQDSLNVWGVNCLRTMPGAGPVIWGSRTLATKADPEWRYVPVRRTAIFIEQSIYEGIQWAVFEPNDHRLWSALRGNIGGFMNSLFRVGAFQGEKASEAYFVRCGLDDTMTQADIDAGQVIVIVGFAPLKPAEFVIVRIQQKVNQQ